MSGGEDTGAERGSLSQMTRTYSTKIPKCEENTSVTCIPHGTSESALAASTYRSISTLALTQSLRLSLAHRRYKCCSRNCAYFTACPCCHRRTLCCVIYTAAHSASPSDATEQLNWQVLLANACTCLHPCTAGCSQATVPSRQSRAVVEKLTVLPMNSTKVASNKIISRWARWPHIVHST